MKKFLITTLIVFLSIIVLICLVNKLGMFDFLKLEITEEELSRYSDYYFNKLNIEEKKIYVKIDQAVKNKEEKVFIGEQNIEDLEQYIATILTAYFYDNPEYYYISNQYLITTNDIKILKYVTINLQYTIKDIEAENAKLESAINKLLSNTIKSGMTDFEKELAIHDALVKDVDYYRYNDINNIPAIKHTAYGALVEKQAVCDGYSKAFKILLERVGIESIIVNGTSENVSHAWNKVKIGDEYYNVDITSDKLNDKTAKYVIHKYFNITDEEIARTHTIDKKFSHPECKSDKYDYYKHKELYLNYEDNLYTKLGRIITVEKNSNIIEVKADKRYDVQTIIDTLYDLDFNKWRTSGKKTVLYNKMQDVYIFLK